MQAFSLMLVGFVGGLLAGMANFADVSEPLAAALGVSASLLLVPSGLYAVALAVEELGKRFPVK